MYLCKCCYIQNKSIIQFISSFCGYAGYQCRKNEDIVRKNSKRNGKFKLFEQVVGKGKRDQS